MGPTDGGREDNRMPTVTVNGAEIYYEDVGQGFPLLFLHGLTFDTRMWTDQVAALSEKYRCVSLDFRGHGHSATTGTEYSLEQFAEDAYGLLKELGIEQAHVAGLSMGGMVAMRLALAHPEVVRSLMLLDTSAHAQDPERASQYQTMAQIIKEQGSEAVVQGVIPIFFSPAFIQGQPQKLEAFREQFRKIDGEGNYRATLAVTRRRDIREDIKGIGVPTLVIVGEEDLPTPVDEAESIHRQIAGSRLEKIAGAGHMTPLEQPEKVTALLEDFLSQAG
jgi:3-oxoadipate enol-lactonase